jgi:simple sugar transport system permease protein
MLEGLFDGALFDSVVRAVIPILAASLGGMICDRAGVFQISLEGMMLTGAFAAVAGSYLGQSSLLGVVFGMASAALLSLVLGYGTVTRRGDPIVLGVAVNLLALGLTSFLLAQIFGVRGVLQHDRIDGLDRIPIPGLSEIGVVGPVIFRMTIPAYLTMIGVAATWVFLFRTKLGLRLRGVGERPLSAETLGVSSTRYKYWAVVVSGLLCGLAGAQLALGNVVQFAENMTSGRGWIAVVAVLLGRAHPLGVLGASVLFGLTEALGFRLQGHARLPVQITDALPFVVTLAALALARKRFTRLLEFGVST